MDTVKSDEQSLTEARDQLKQAERDFEVAVRKAYQHLVYLTEGYGDVSRLDEIHTFQEENQTALNGQTAWKALVERGKAFDVGTFDAKVLLANLRDNDYGRPLDELRNSFWNSPRMPLLPHGESDLRRAIFEAVAAGDLRVVGADGELRAVSSETGIALNQSGLRLARPEEATTPEGSEPVSDGQGAAHEKEPPRGDDETPSAKSAVTQVDHEVAITLTTNLDDGAQARAIYSLLLEIAEAVDGDASHFQLMVKIVAPEPATAKVAQSAQAANANVNSRELPS